MSVLNSIADVTVLKHCVSSVCSAYHRRTYRVYEGNSQLLPTPHCIVAWRLKVEIAEPGRRPLHGSGSANTSSPRHRWRHATIGELWEAVLPRVPAPGWHCRCNVTRDTTPPILTENGVFCWVRSEAISGKSKQKKPRDLVEQRTRGGPMIQWEKWTADSFYTKLPG
jgi:hypothetical protein